MFVYYAALSVFIIIFLPPPPSIRKFKNLLSLVHKQELIFWWYTNEDEYTKN